MSRSRDRDQSSHPLPVPSSDSPKIRGRSPPAASNPRASSIARLVSPVPSNGHQASPALAPTHGQSPVLSGIQSPLQGIESSSPLPGPGHSALAQAFHGSLGRSPPRHGTPPVRLPSPPGASSTLQAEAPSTQYGSFESKQSGFGHRRESSVAGEDPRVVRRHLVQPSRDSLRSNGDSDGNRKGSVQGASTRHVGLNEDEFSSLKLQGGDITREVYRWTEDAESPTLGGRGKRSKSWHIARPDPEDETEDYQSIRMPGGFRRDHLRRSAQQQSPPEDGSASGGRRNAPAPPQVNFLSQNFLEFLTLYGHFAGEELEDEDDEDDDDYFTSRPYLPERFQRGTRGDDEESSEDESRALITPQTPGRRRRKTRGPGEPGTTSPTGAALLLLKSFVGTGVLFLPRAYLNGGMLFSNVVLLGVAMLSYYCFILLVNTRLKVNGSFGDIGGILYGRWLRFLILTSVAMSQIGFVSAYIVFTSENLQAFIVAVSKCRTWIDIKFMVLMQLIIFLPLSLIRDISKLGGTALVADAFILLGLVYLYYFDIYTIASNHGVSDIIPFNSESWSLFIGTAIFTFEGVGLIIPIQESMRHPAKFPPVLAGVMIVITVVFVSMGALSYAAFGSKTKTVVLLNLPQDNKFVNSVQLLYSLAILLSTPLQLFPAIRIMEAGLFSRSGKFDRLIKWKKNIFRFVLVVCCALIAWVGAGDLDKFVSLVGSFACVPLVYVYPAMLHYRGVATTRTQKIIDVVLCFFGLVAMVYTTGQTINSWIHAPKVIKAPSYCNT